MHLKVPRRRGGGRLKQFQKSGLKVVEWEGGQKIVPFGGLGGGMDVCWNNPFSVRLFFRKK